jgi:hypothetical protein
MSKGNCCRFGDFSNSSTNNYTTDVTLLGQPDDDFKTTFSNARVKCVRKKSCKGENVSLLRQY